MHVKYRFYLVLKQRKKVVKQSLKNSLKVAKKKARLELTKIHHSHLMLS